MHGHVRKLVRGACRRAVTIGLAAALAAPATAEPLKVLSLPNGYTSHSIELGMLFAGAIAPGPAASNKVYVTAASVAYGPQHILAVDTVAGTTTPVAGPAGSIGGMAVLPNGDIVFAENMTSGSIFRAHDGNGDGDFLDTGEVEELIAPILADSPFGFTGAQIAVAPAGNASAIPAGAVVLQTADGGTSGELLVIENPAGTPAYRPAGAAYYSGFAYNGGVAFDPAGNLVMGTSTAFFTGNIVALVNTNANQQIDAGESHVIVGDAHLGSGMADLAVSGEGQVFFTETSGAIRSFALPANLLGGTAVPQVFAQTDGAYLSAVRFDDPARTFAPGAGGSTARMYVSGYLGSWTPATNILVIEPAPLSAVGDWTMYE